jgi:uncharacterized repeat protein (TIGR01451 family)/fimbrial isopeptide formation D2 family protein
LDFGQTLRRALLGLCAFVPLVLPIEQALGAMPGSCTPDAGVAFIEHDLSISWCELCGEGEVHLSISNPLGVDLTNLTVREDLRVSGLTYVPGSTRFVGTYVITPGAFEPTVSGTNNSVLTWSFGGFELPGPKKPSQSNRHSRLDITFKVRRDAGLSDEGLVLADRRVRGTLSYRSSCDAFLQTESTALEELPIRQPIPRVIKTGRNVDAAQGSWSDPVYGNINDDLIWRIEIRNSGLAPMQDILVSDAMGPGNFLINYACPTNTTAAAVASNNGVAPGGSPCRTVGPTTSISDFVVDDPFGNPGNDEPTTYVDAPASGSAYVYLVGKATSSCNNRTNTASGLEWGCEIDNPDGGISVPASTRGVTPSVTLSDSALFSTVVGNGDLQVQRQIRGTNFSQPVGSKGTVRLTLTNNTGGTVKNIKLKDLLPAEYVVDPTFTPTVSIDPAYGNYAGMTDRITWTNPVPGTFPLSTADPALPLGNTTPEFELWSSTVHPNYPDQRNLLRHGDRLVVEFRIVMIKPDYYDKVANLDVREEAPNSDPPDTDPDNDNGLTNRLWVDFEQFCQPGVIQHPSSYPYVDTNIPASPEDLDVDIDSAGGELIFILTNNPAQPLPLTVEVTNNGGHDARDWTTFVTFGATMSVVAAPSGCAVASNPPPLAVWRQPAPIPANATVYQCTGNVIAPGQTVRLNFDVVKSSDPLALAADDLTFRADLVGEITLSDGTPLWFPTPDTSVIANRANNYSLDGVRARVIGFNLLKTQLGTCSENNPPPGSPDDQVQIGEECDFHIDTGGWFGFQTPGFTYIAVQDIQVVDELPDGQGYLASSDPYTQSTSAIAGVSLNPAGLSALDEGHVDWTFNRVVPGERIMQKDEWFRVDIRTRLLNDPIDTRAAPNVHAALSRNVLDSTFQAVFNNESTGEEEVYDLGPSTLGYPIQAVRRVDLTVTEPNLLVVKEVCNETLYGEGAACSHFVPLADDGDAYNAYVYRITLTNQASSSGVIRAPAYDVNALDVLDPSDLMYVLPFESDGLDNDGDGLIDAADTDGEGTIGDNVVRNGTPAQIAFSHTHSDALLRVDAGQSVTFWYRVDPDDTVAPLQALVNTVTMSYDSLEGDTGNQSTPQRPTGDAGGARRYETTPASATVRIIPVLTQPKHVVRLSDTPVGGAPQPVAIGEEIEYQLNTLLPVARLRDFVIRDELPEGIRCVEAPAVNLDAAPYSAAGFVPGGIITPTCTDTHVEWDFGDQQITHGTVDNRYDFAIRFIARVDNTAYTNDGLIIGNGGAATTVTARYVDETGTPVVLDFGRVDVVVQEPAIALTKAFDVAAADAGDELTVTVTATNTGSARAYNLRVLDDLAGAGNLTYLGNVGGLDPPDVVDTTSLGPNRPVFSWNPTHPKFGIAPGDSVSFTFKVRVDITAQPQQILDNTLQASWTSLPGRTTALNSTGTLGPDGDAMGMRVGVLPNLIPPDPVNDYEASAEAAFSIPPVTMAKQDEAPGTVPTIGAHKHFRLEIRLPEGTTESLVVRDNLAAGPLSYVLSNNADFDVSYSFAGIASINGAPPSETALLAFPADGSTGVAVWDVGTVVTASEDDLAIQNITPLIRIDYHARIDNVVQTQAGDVLQNGVEVAYTHGQSGEPVTLTDDTPAVTVREALLTVSKNWRNVTPGKAAGDAPDGGDLLEFTVTIPNSGDSIAHDVNVADTLSAHLLLDAGFTPSVTINAVAVSGFVSIPAGAPAGPLVWGRDNGDDSLDIPAGETLLLTYRTRVANEAEPGVVLANSVYVDWTSLDGASGYERTGAGCPDITEPNDYCTGPAVTSTTLVDTNTVAKMVLEDSYTDAPLSTATDAVVRVGDTITYRLDLQLQEGRTREVRVEDTLPNGMAFLDTVSINGDISADYTPPASGAGSNFSYAPITAAQRPTAGQTGTLVWDLGTVVNDALGDATTDTLEITYRARVMPDAGIAHVGGLDQTNTANLSYVDADGVAVAPAPRLTSSATADLRQPVVTLSKTDRSGRTSGTSVNVATDVMNFRVSACNDSGEAPAYDLLLKDTLASQLDETSLTGPVVTLNGAPAIAGTDYVYTPPAGRGGTWELDVNTPLLPGQCLHVDYDIGFHLDVGAQQAWQNSALLAHYYSLPGEQGQEYGPVGPAVFSMHTVWPIWPPAKTFVSPATGEATIGEEVVFRITVPDVPAGESAPALHDVLIADDLHPALEFIAAQDVSGNGLALIDESLSAHQVRLRLPLIEAGQQAVVELRARVANNEHANAGVALGNTASYSFANTAGGAAINGGSAGTGTVLTIVEPRLTLTKTVQNLTSPGAPPNAGHMLRYTLEVTAEGGTADDDYADAFELSVLDQLSLGLAYQGNATVSGAGNSIDAPVIAGDGVDAAQALRWSAADGNAAIDLGEGEVLTLSYDVRVLDGVLANQALNNAASVQWTGRDGAVSVERDGSGVPVYNDYFTAPAIATVTTADGTGMQKTHLTDTWNGGDADVRIGDLVQYELRVPLNPGTTASAVVVDTLPQGLAFAGTLSVNSDTSAPFTAVPPFAHAPLGAAVVAGDPRAGPSTVTWSLGDVINQSDGDTGNDAFVIVYLARVLDGALTQVADTPLNNTARIDYVTATGTATRSEGETIALRQPVLAITKSAAPEGGDSVLAADERVDYTVEIRNNGTAPAYDAVLRDVIPTGMRNGAATVTVISTTLAGAPVANLQPVYDSATGVVVWDFDTGVADQYTIPPGESLRVIYQVQTDRDLGAGLTLSNAAQVERYYSLDDDDVPVVNGVQGVREVYGPSNVATVDLTTAAPLPLAKQNPAQTTAAIGEPFSYRITVPATPQETALHDVRILDDLGASAADLRFVSVQRVAGSQTWVPENTGSATALVIEDTAQGIDIPAGEQIVIDITVVLEDSATNVSGLHFQNTAHYSYTAVSGDESTRANGGADTTPDMIIAGPDNLTLVKSGPAQMRTEAPGSFRLEVHNAGTGTAWDLSVVDVLPNPDPGGMCDAAPDNITAQVFENDGVTPVSPPLVAGTDFINSFTGAPDCTLRITMRTPAAAVAADQRLIVTYQAYLDGDNVDGTDLTNIAGVTRWFSADTDGTGAGDAREYTRALSTEAEDAAATLDHEDAHTVTTEMPVLMFQKSVSNVTTSQDPGSDARPGDILRYSVRITNVSSVALSDFSLQDELDRLNATPLFQPGTLQLITVPAGADVSLTDPAGGDKGTGLVYIRGLRLDAQGGANDSVLVEFSAQLLDVITSGTRVLNQAQLQSPVLHTHNSDDPNVNGNDQPDVLGDEDPTETHITSAPILQVLKTSTDVTGDASELMAGDTLRYTLRIKNIGDENAEQVALSDQIPANTAYVPNSTRLNGVPVADPAPGVSPLQDGMRVHAPENPTPGFLRADAGFSNDNVAVVTFDVRIDPNAADATPIANQGFVNGSGLGSGPLDETPSDDPATPAPNDPTRDVVGNVPLVDALKTVSIVVDNGTPGIVDPGDVLRYTISITNLAATPATNVVFVDAVPANTTYVPDSTTLNGLPVARPDAGVSPLAAGIAVSSSDRTPPLPTGTDGILSPWGIATLSFDVTVNAGVPAGTVISNQGTVTSNEQAPEPTDADGNDDNGDQATEIVVGQVQRLAIIKSVSVVGGGPVLAGGELEYLVRVNNPGTVPATHVLISDDVGALAGTATYVAGSATLNGSTQGIAVVAGELIADYSTHYGALPPGGSVLLRFRVQLEPALAIGARITNTAQVEWNSPRATATASVSVDVGGTPGSASLNGHVWHDGNLNKTADGSETRLADWVVEVFRDGRSLGSVLTDGEGQFRVTGLAPNDLSGEGYELRFRAPGAASTTAALGWSDSGFTNGLQHIKDIIAGSGSNLLDLNLPLQPNGVVYDAVTRAPAAGVTLTLRRAANDVALPASCFDDPAQQGQVTGTDGFYKFDVNFADPACAAPGEYLIAVTPPTKGFLDGPSRIIPPETSAATSAFQVPACPGGVDDALPGTADLCEIQASESAPPVSVAARTAATRYHLHLGLDDGSIPRDSQVFNNHIPVDPHLNTAIAITKTAAKVNVTRGEIVPYTITVRNTLTAPLHDLAIVDSFPAGFKYVEGSARVDGQEMEPVRNGRQLVWSGLDLEVDAQHTVTLLLIVGSGVTEGDYENRAQVFNVITGAPASGEAGATVRVVPDPTFDCTDVIGKAFDDANRNGYQDPGEAGLPGVRLITARGLIVTADQHGRFHITCAAVPDEDRGSNFILKLDDRSLPSGYRVTTENPLVLRATRGKMLKFNFGAALHRVVSLGIADAVFEPESTAMRPQWKPRLGVLLEELRKSPSVLRLTYLGDVEDEALVARRVAQVKADVEQLWQQTECCRPLTIETEIFWRRGAPPERRRAP